MGFTGMFSVETILKIIGFGVKVGANNNKTFKLLIVLKNSSLNSKMHRLFKFKVKHLIADSYIFFLFYFLLFC